MVVDTSVIEHPESRFPHIQKVNAISSDHTDTSSTYDHRTLKTRLPVRSALFKQRTGGLVVRWVTTSEYPLLYVFVFFADPHLKQQQALSLILHATTNVSIFSLSASLKSSRQDPVVPIQCSHQGQQFQMARSVYYQSACANLGSRVGRHTYPPAPQTSISPFFFLSMRYGPSSLTWYSISLGNALVEGNPQSHL